MECYKNGGCGVYEMYSCSECPASKPTYRCKNCLSYSQCKNIILKGVFVVENCSSFPYLKEKILREKEAEQALKEKKLREAEIKESQIKSFFRNEVCPNIPCGSQRCDASDEWLDGCRTFQEFKVSISEVVEKYKNYK